MSDKIRVIFYQEHGLWLAQGLEKDICVQADKLDDLYGRFEVAARLECAETENLDHIGKAPKHFWDMWERKSGGFKPSKATNDQFEVGLAA